MAQKIQQKSFIITDENERQRKEIVYRVANAVEPAFNELQITNESSH